ncbi:MAG: UDP-N-acetylglucosamine 1-carboxyvinyltransferase [Nanoarchaeota archaeon]|nr:UDP-N-acetylglucosamine 1-carboxyvinyltransferase [Nanoarchaeota archaeon]MBU1030488.1 UDP-N-acetylglucosamine 1-carboxyvinyltransferase [Nanoarchaeota archaeon]MBU1850442.1 UDP-N-acetylglucosamine 1-carboxyvinyltransferase [Nanoarchaeota archaeon]
MRKIIINGNKKLNGIVNISGSKNESLAVMCGALLSDDKVILRNVPNIKDVSIMKDLIDEIGYKVKSSDKIIINPPSNKKLEINEQASEIRNSILLLGPLTAKYGRVIIPLPGGCSIGNRPINFHIEGLKKLGAKIKIINGLIHSEAEKLVGAKIRLDFPSVGATCNLMMAASLAKGETKIFNSAKEPEVQNLAKFLNQMGAEIKGIGTDTLIIQGKKELSGTEYSIKPDRIETITYMILGSFPMNKINIRNTVKEDLSEVIETLKRMGVFINCKNNEIMVEGRTNQLKSTAIIAKPHPGFPTDALTLITPLLSYAKGISKITDKVFPERFSYIKELNKMGANTQQLEYNSVKIMGSHQLFGAKVSCHDLRGGMALVLAGLFAKGETIIEDVHYINRGYENYIEKLQSLGADIKQETY